jgi:RNA polymerase sigma-70 factor, ECF subfamily
MADAFEETMVGVPVMRSSVGGIGREDFDRIVLLHQRRIYRVLLAQLRDPDAAASLTQECFLRAYQGLDGFRGEASVSTWLIRIALNLAKDHRRSRRQSFWRRLFERPEQDFAEMAAEVPGPGPSAERSLLAREEVDQVLRAVGNLSPQQRAVFTLRFLEEMSIEEIAAATGLEPGTVKTHLSRAVGALRQMRKGRATK